MKKILLLFCLFVFSLSSYSQTTLQERIDDLYVDWKDEYLNGNLEYAAKLELKYMRVIGQWTNLVTSIGLGDSETAGDCLDELNDIFNTSYSLPDFNFSETTASYFDIDSIKLRLMDGYVSDLLTSTDVISLIASNPSVDSSFVNTRIEEAIDSIDFPSSDSSWVSASVEDFLFMGEATNYISISENGYPADVDERYSRFSFVTAYGYPSTGTVFHITSQYGKHANVYDGGGLYTWRSDLSPTLLPHINDTNTGVGWISSDYMNIITGGTEIMSLRNNGGNLNIEITGSVESDTCISDVYIDDSGDEYNYLSGLETLPVADSVVNVATPTGFQQFNLIKKTLNSEALIYEQDATPNIPVNHVAFWDDTDGTSVYLIFDLSGTQYYLEMGTTP